MLFTSKNKINFNSLTLNVQQGASNPELNFSKKFSDSLAKREFTFSLNIDGEEYNEKGKFGADAIWLPINPDFGIKIIRTENETGFNTIYENIEYIKSIDSEVFPKIEWVERAKYDKYDCIVTKMQNIEENKSPVNEIPYLNEKDQKFVNDSLHTPLKHIEQCITEFIKYELLPEVSWYKNKGIANNVINGKVVDFHMFRHMPSRYIFPANCSVGECKDIFKDAVGRYKEWSKRNNEPLPKWKGKIYQGMKFSNGYTMPGYTSDNITYDSYKKINFIPFDKIKDKKVLDLGSNQGFFSFQAALHGATSVTGIELTEDDVITARNINEKILKLDNVEFINGDLIDYLENDNNFYELIMMNSVLHQTHPKLEECGEFYKKYHKSVIIYFWKHQ